MVRTCLIFGLMCAVTLPGWSDETPQTPIDLSQFQDSISHWQKKYGRDRNDPRYAPGQITEIAENLLQFQNSDGGWPKDLDWLANIDYEMVRGLRGESLKRSTLDNHSTFPQVEYLAKVYRQTRDARFRAAAERGLDYILHEQRPTGGWRGADVDAITFNDDVMTGVMAVLLDIRNGVSHFDWLDDARRRSASIALDKAIDCTLSCQIVVNGQKTAWCQQHDHTTFAPVRARKYELASICSRESVDVLRFLMALPNPDNRIAEAVNAGVAWLRSVAIQGVRLEKAPMDPVRFENHTAAFDLVVVHDDTTPPIWARFYTIENNRPLFCRRDGTVVSSFAEVDLERRTGYAWYGSWPDSIIQQDYPAWQKRWTE